MKRRFPIFQGVIRTESERACQYIAAGTILHNIAVNLRDPPFGEDVKEIGGRREIGGRCEIAEYVGLQSHRGVVFRDYIANTYF